MIKDLFKKYIYPIFTFAGGIVGVGFLSLPYVAMKVGIWITIVYFILVTGIVLALNLMFSEISLKTPDFKRFPGFVGFHLGKVAQTFSVLSAIFSGVTVLSIYILVGSTFLTTVFAPIFGGNILYYALIYFIAGSALIFFDIKAVSKAAFWVLSLLALSFIFIFFQGFGTIRLNHILFVEPGSTFSNLFLPYGALLFSLWGVGLIPETEEMLRGSKANLKKILAIATISIAVFYFLFTILILSISGTNTSQMALTNLPIFLDGWVVSVAMLAGAAATFTAFIAQGLIFKKVLMYDLKIKKGQAFIMACSAPLILFLLGFNDFISLISFVGGILLGIDGILIALMYKKVKKNRLPVYFLGLIFLLGIIYQIIYFAK